ncbi:DapH/DapD/GlmU-related protein [Sphingomonas sp. BGYR3]|uniref:DapH/DapD/GlmU-related protein n=1 Tax=Sphingomonas sp. BGYR3 TaxID=2975483 RepID=UPI0024354CA3|nr:DapH/DapD/GlmU-related protein [Sphingomonas sp. BGYR3]MDG5489254.1 DapH/DapD/GlmU-related protein [Sphingomonas sp. BGYR3]
MARRSLDQLHSVRMALLSLRRRWLSLRHGLRMPASSSISLSGRIVGGGPDSIVIGEHSLVAFKTLLIARDSRTGQVRPIRIGNRCFIGGGSVILPGVTIGDGCVIGSGSVVFDDVPSGSIVAGNPARVIKSGVTVGPRGRLMPEPVGETGN